MIEYEVKFLEIDVERVEKKLEELDADKESDEVLKQIIYDQPDRSWNKIHKRVRLRKTGAKIELAYKELLHNEGVDGTKEYEFEVNSWGAADAFVKQMGLIAVREEEKRRISYTLGGVHFDIDYWPKLPPFLEIESDSEEKVRLAAENLGLNWQDACFLDAKQVYEEIYNIKNYDDKKIVTFERFE